MRFVSILLAADAESGQATTAGGPGYRIVPSFHGDTDVFTIPQHDPKRLVVGHVNGPDFVGMLGNDENMAASANSATDEKDAEGEKEANGTGTKHDAMTLVTLALYRALVRLRRNRPPAGPPAVGTWVRRLLAKAAQEAKQDEGP